MESQQGSHDSYGDVPLYCASQHTTAVIALTVGLQVQPFHITFAFFHLCSGLESLILVLERSGEKLRKIVSSPFAFFHHGLVGFVCVLGGCGSHTCLRLWFVARARELCGWPKLLGVSS